MDVDTTSGRINYHDGTNSSLLVSEISTDQGANRLKNKDLEAGSTKIVDGTDTSKKIAFQTSGATASTTLTITESQSTSQSLAIPNVGSSDSIVTNNTSAVLTNKTLSGNTATNLVNGSGTFDFNSSGTITAPNATDTLVGKATTDVLTNKSLVDTSTAIVDSGDNTIQLKFDPSGTTGTATTFATSQTGNITLSFPSQTDTIMGLTSLMTVSNKLLKDDTVYFVDPTNTTKALKVALAGATAGKTTTITAAQTLDRTITLPDASITVNLGTDINSGAATSGQVLTANGSGASSFTTISANLTSPKEALNYSLTTSVGSNQMTVALKNNAGNDPSSGDPVKITFRNSTATTGTSSEVSIQAATSIVISSGATLGLVSAQNQYIYVYLLNNAGTAELAVSGSRFFDEGTLQSTTTMSGSATSSTVLYSTTGRSNVGVRLIGRLQSNQTTSGTYASNATEVSTVTSFQDRQQWSEVIVDTANGHGSTATMIRRFTNTRKSVGSAITFADSSTNGASFTINEDGIYAMSYSDTGTADYTIGITVNDTATTTVINSVTYAQGKRAISSMPTGDTTNVQWTGRLKAGDVLRCHDRGNTDGTTDSSMVSVIKIAD